ncbi:MAG TPA: superinfection immunity protein [Acidobacteriaceae bacterium]|nr:superinfection immunity protein [Acidobacteriaceae bacterium]
MHIFFMVFLLPMLVLHFLPAIIAGVRHARNFGWILVINIFLSWTVVGWIIALIWAICDTPRYYYAPYVPPSAPPYNVR